MESSLFSITMEFLHLIATVIWIGGMFFNIFVLRPSLGIIEQEQRVKLGYTVLKRFLPFAWISIIILFITGIFLRNYETLIFKHIIVLFMVLIVAIISFILFPKLTPIVLQERIQDEKRKELIKINGKIVLLVKINLMLGILVMLLTIIFKEVKVCV